MNLDQITKEQLAAPAPENSRAAEGARGRPETAPPFHSPALRRAAARVVEGRSRVRLLRVPPLKQEQL